MYDIRADLILGSVTDPKWFPTSPTTPHSK